MPLSVLCAGCKRKLRVADTLIGKAIKCPHCAHKMVVKKPAAPALAGAAARPAAGQVKKAPAKGPPPKPTAAAKVPPPKPAPAKTPAAAKPPAKPIKNGAAAKAPPAKAPAKPAAAASKPPAKPAAAPKPAPKPAAAAPKPAVPPRPAVAPKPAPPPAPRFTAPPPPTRPLPSRPVPKPEPETEEEAKRKKLIKYLVAGILFFLALGVVLALFWGSSAGQVTGVVTLDGEPLVGAEVIFRGEKEKLGPFKGTTIAGGQYKLIGNTAAGIPLGSYKVTVTHLAPKGKGVVMPTTPVEIAKLKAEGKLINTIPPMYSDEQKTPLVYTVKSGSNPLDLPLKKGP
jgi:DNA-directed RNA polymerase subunit RPC12/RpoP